MARPPLPTPPGGENVTARRKTRVAALDLTAGLSAAAEDVCALVPELAHVRVPEVHFAVFYSRAARRTLTYARCYPLSRRTRKRGKRTYRLTPVHTVAGTQASYVLAFAWQRYWELAPRERLLTLAHELYHVGPAFDGEARSFERGGWHGPSRKWFDARVEEMTDRAIPADFALSHPVLAAPLEGLGRVQFERLVLPRWLAAGQ